MAEKNFTIKHSPDGSTFDILYPETTIGQVQNLQNTLDAKVDANTSITAATKAKITYDSKGLVTGGEDLVENDIPALHLTKVADVTASATELNYVDGVTSAIQPQIDSKQSAIIYSQSQPASQEIGGWWYEDTTLDPQLLQPLTFTANTAGSTVTLGKTGSPAWTGSYSTDGTNWVTYTPGTTGAITLTNTGDKVYFKGDITQAFNNSNYLIFSATGSIAASGNINSMYVSSDFEYLTTLTYAGCYNYMFSNCSSLTSAPMLPATTLSTNCYKYMFRGCTNLVSCPALPATTLVSSCYYNMFYGCTSLTTPPTLPATTLVSSCYRGMFLGCTSLITAPAIPATNCAVSSMDDMFNGCTSLIKPPKLQMVGVGSNANSGFKGMFNGCTSLEYVPNLYSTRLGSYTYKEMFKGCTKLYISDTQTAEAPYAWTIPKDDVCTQFTGTSTTDMFKSCLGVRSTDTPDFTDTQLTFYTQNEPV